ncbi:hypothetical protein [Arhodomonas sp. AD133]|uniref:hypothetical protein n=1 Tax=Arhodomonas sp. AD133 TaxID=3415009 RepID=UPI003EB9B064
MVLDPQYRTNECFAGDGSTARLIGGMNDTFNRVESRTRSLEWTPGFSRAESQNGLMRLAYQYLFQLNQPWTPNLNGAERIVPNEETQYEVDIPETTIDLKEHLTLSWQRQEQGTATDVLIVSGTQQQTGTFSGAYGAAKDIEADVGLEGSQPDGTAKAPVTLPAGATKRWDLADAVSDAYVVEFTAHDGIDAESHTLGVKRGDGVWRPIAKDRCMVDGPYNPAWLTQPPARPAACAHEVLAGYDSNHGNRWWAVLRTDAEVALVPR